MPYKRKNSPYYWISYTDENGKRVRESSGHTTRKDAAALEAKKRLAVHQHTRWGAEPPRSFDTLIANYLIETESKKSHERDIYSAKALAPHFSGLDITDITPEAITSYRQNREVSNGTVAKELRFLSAAINYAKKHWGWKIENVVTGRIPPAPPHRVRWLTRDEAANLIATAQKLQFEHTADIIRLVLNTGMRKSEVLGLTWAQVDFGARLIYLTPDKAKSGKNESIPLNNTAIAVLRNWEGKHQRRVFIRKGKPIDSVRRSFASTCKAAGIENFHFHDLRHTFAAWLVQRGIPIRTVSELMRHSDISTTMIYAHLSPDNIRAAVEAIECDQNVTEIGNNVPRLAHYSKNKNSK